MTLDSLNVFTIAVTLQSVFVEVYIVCNGSFHENANVNIKYTVMQIVVCASVRLCVHYLGNVMRGSRKFCQRGSNTDKFFCFF